MTQTTNRFFDEMARLMNDAAGAARVACRFCQSAMVPDRTVEVR